MDPCSAFGNADRPPNYFMELIQSWGPSLKYMLLVANSPSVDIGVLGTTESSKGFENWMLREPYNAIMPIDDDQNDTWPVGFALDLRSQTPLPPPTPDEDPYPPCPILWVLNNVGWLYGYHVMNMEALRDKTPCPMMVIPERVALPTIEKPKLNIAPSPSVVTSKVEFKAPVAPNVKEKAQIKPPAFATASPKETPKPSFPPTTAETKAAIKPKEQPKKATPPPEPPEPQVDALLVKAFDDIYKGFSSDLDMLGGLAKKVSQTAEEAGKASKTDACMMWTLGNLAQVSSLSDTLYQSLSEMSISVSKIRDAREDLQSALLSAFAKKEESGKRLEMLKSEQLEQEAAEMPLGPEAQDLKNKILQKKRGIETTVIELVDVLDSLKQKVDSHQKGSKTLGSSFDWYTICQTVHRITSSAIATCSTLESLEVQMKALNLFSPVKKVSSAKPTPSKAGKENRGPSQSSFGLRDTDLDDTAILSNIISSHSTAVSDEEMRAKATEYIQKMLSHSSRKPRITRPKSVRPPVPVSLQVKKSDIVKEPTPVSVPSTSKFGVDIRGVSSNLATPSTQKTNVIPSEPSTLILKADQADVSLSFIAKDGSADEEDIGSVASPSGSFAFAPTEAANSSFFQSSKPILDTAEAPKFSFKVPDPVKNKISTFSFSGPKTEAQESTKFSFDAPAAVKETKAPVFSFKSTEPAKALEGSGFGFKPPSSPSPLIASKTTPIVKPLFDAPESDVAEKESAETTKKEVPLPETAIVAAPIIVPASDSTTTVVGKDKDGKSDTEKSNENKWAKRSSVKTFGLGELTSKTAAFGSFKNPEDPKPFSFAKPDDKTAPKPFSFGTAPVFGEKKDAPVSLFGIPSKELPQLFGSQKASVDENPFIISGTSTETKSGGLFATATKTEASGFSFGSFALKTEKATAVDDKPSVYEQKSSESSKEVDIVAEQEIEAAKTHAPESESPAVDEESSVEEPPQETADTEENVPVTPTPQEPDVVEEAEDVDEAQGSFGTPSPQGSEVEDNEELATSEVPAEQLSEDEVDEEVETVPGLDEEQQQTEKVVPSQPKADLSSEDGSLPALEDDQSEVASQVMEAETISEVPEEPSLAGSSFFGAVKPTNAVNPMFGSQAVSSSSVPPSTGIDHAYCFTDIEQVVY